ncbi:unnamed protein product [Ambrosiozyma monospora]|uniref:Unnamed protein product n=1 Tax=Ambrosiozyma monospora TaxID=43982 RepID=A0ACB5TCF4_AMBMO|nr:unnamed protein product [Ambrosiozyma monospora]
MDLIESTASTSRYQNKQITKMWRLFGYSMGGTTGMLAMIHAWLSFRYPEIMHYGDYGIYGIYAAIVSYLVNCGFLASLAFSSKGLENGNLMYAKNTLPHNWYIKLNELKMCSKVVLADAEINGEEGFATREIVERVKKLGYEVNEPEQEVMLRQYWYSSGEGFVWCEPDLDPAELLWWDHLHDVGVKTIWDVNYERLQEQQQEQQRKSLDGNDADDDDMFLLDTK